MLYGEGMPVGWRALKLVEFGNTLSVHIGEAMHRLYVSSPLLMRPILLNLGRWVDEQLELPRYELWVGLDEVSLAKANWEQL